MVDMIGNAHEPTVPVDWLILQGSQQIRVPGQDLGPMAELSTAQLEDPKPLLLLSSPAFFPGFTLIMTDSKG